MSTETLARGQGYSLPLFATRENKYGVGAIVALIAAMLYLASNHYPFFKPQLLPMSWLDQVTPLVPNTIWIYVSEYIFFGVVYLNCRDMLNLNKYLYSFLALQVVSVLIFWAWPTTYPRDLYPLPTDTNNLTFAIFSSLRDADSPNNCCPSLHVSSVFLSSFIFLDEQRWKFPFFFLWGVAIAASTLTTKQHYLVDVITGLLMALAIYWIFHRMISYRPFRGFQAKR